MLFLLLSLFLFFHLFLFLEFLLLSLLFLLLLLEVVVVFFEVDPAVIDYDFLGLLLVGEEIGVAPEEAKDSVKEAIDVAFLLDHRHQDSVKFVVLGHLPNYQIVIMHPF